MNTDNPGTPNPASSDDDIISLSEIIAIIANGKLWIAAATLLFLLLSLVYIWAATPIYRADALIQVESQKSPLGGLVEMTDALGGETSPSDTEIEVIRSRFVLGRVVESEKLNVVAQPHYFPLIGQPIARRFKPEVPGELNSPLLWFSGYAWGGESIYIQRFTVPETMKGQSFTLISGTEGRYQLELDDEVVLEGMVGELAASSNDINLFVAELKARPGTRFSLVRLPMISAISDLSNRLSVSERGNKTGVLSLALTGPDKADNKRILEAIAQRYLRQNVERVSAEAQNSLKFLEQQLPLVKEQLELSEERLNNYRLENQTVDLTLETQAVLDQAVTIDTQLAQMDIQIQQMSQRYTANHPIIQELEQQRSFLEERKGEFVSQTESLPETQQEVLRLARNVEVNTLVYTELLNKSQELKIVEASAVGNVRILDHALSAIEAIKPKKSLIVVLATLLGGMLGMGIVFVREMLRQGVKTPEEIESKVGLSVYATVPLSNQQGLLERNSQKQGGGYLLAKTAPGDLAVESLRSLRTNLVFALMESQNNRIMITGPSPGIGKSFISSNLGLVLAESGKKVLLIDADMRKGHMNKAFDLPRNNGLAECVVGQLKMTDALHKVTENLDILTTGHYPPNPSELLMTPAFKKLLDDASENYDVVLVDTPPILAVTDPVIIGKLCGTAFMVVRAEMNPIREVEYAATRFKQAGVHINGCVLNGMVQSSSRYGNYGYYQYSYN